MDHGSLWHIIETHIAKRIKKTNKHPQNQPHHFFRIIIQSQYNVKQNTGSFDICRTAIIVNLKKL